MNVDLDKFVGMDVEGINFLESSCFLEAEYG
jgi:hypothetical protein